MIEWLRWTVLLFVSRVLVGLVVDVALASPAGPAAGDKRDAGAVWVDAREHVYRPVHTASCWCWRADD